ncbi:MCE family protein [Pseudonocardia halophobica]|uniref:MCE family protein n=1 Tax=Pseudonocardia halophobica TaxID=29401 RepID=UPI003D924FDC
MKLRFREKNPVVIAIAGIVGLLVVLFGSFQLAALPVFAGTSYEARFAEGGGLKAGDIVTVAGTEVGKVSSVDLDGADVVVTFTAKGVTLGDATRATIRTQTLLGERRLGIEPAGDGALSSGDSIPRHRTTSPYSVTQGIEDLTRRTGEVDMDQLGEAMNTFSDAFSDTPDDIGAAFAGITRISQTIASRDQALRELFGHAEKVTEVLKTNTGKLSTLLVNGNSLLQELERRRESIHSLLVNTKAVADQIVGLTEEQRNRLKPALDQLNAAMEVLQRNEGNIVSSVQRVSSFITGLGEGLATGPYFTGHGDLTGVAPVVFPLSDYIPSLTVPNNPVAGAVPELPAPSSLIGLGGN